MPETLRRGTVPAWLFVLAALGLTALVLPLVGLSARVPWAKILSIMAEDNARAALWLSLRTCLLSTALSVVLGIPTAIVLARRWPGVKVARVVVLLPMALPPVVAGLALLQTFGRRGLVGAWLDSVGIQIGFTTTAVVLAQTFVSMPFLVVALQGALQVREQGHEAIAATLGAGPTRILTRVTLPLVLPAILQGTALALARSLGEFGATLTFAGSLAGVTRTMPLEIYLERETDPEVALALAAVLIGVAICVVAVTAWQQRGTTRAPVSSDDDEASVSSRPSGVATGKVAAEKVAAENAAAVEVATVKKSVSSPDARAASDSPVHPPERLTAHVVVPERHVDVELEVPAGTVTALLGRNGSGKSTCVQAMAGLLDAPGSTLTVGERTLDRGARRTPARKRGISLLTQRPLLFPHLTALDNVAFGLRARGVSAKDARARAAQELQAVGCGHLAERRPWQLSGGQAARVALARALAVDPAVLFLDEPMAALDVDAAAAMRSLLAQRFADHPATVVVVTHNLLDVARLAHRVVVLEDGAVVEEGPAQETLTRPRTPFTAALAGMNMVMGQAQALPQEDLLQVDAGPVAIVGVVDDEARPGVEAVALFAPSAVSLYPADQVPQGSPRNLMRARVLGVEQAGRLARVALRIRDTSHIIYADLTLGSVRSLGIDVGVWMMASVKAAEVSVVLRG